MLRGSEAPEKIVPETNSVPGAMSLRKPQRKCFGMSLRKRLRASEAPETQRPQGQTVSEASETAQRRMSLRPLRDDTPGSLWGIGSEAVCVRIHAPCAFRRIPKKNDENNYTEDHSCHTHFAGFPKKMTKMTKTNIRKITYVMRISQDSPLK